jgi:hypothetical protein
MNELSDEQLELVLARIRREGIRQADLEADILDHISCLIEAEMNSSPSFEEAFEKVFRDFSPAGGLQRIQFEIKYISTEKIMPMKKTLIIVSSLAMMFLFVSMLFQAIKLMNNYPWPVMEAIAFVNQFLVCLLVLPFYWLQEYKSASLSEDGLSTSYRKLMFIAGLCCSEALVMAVFFKLMHMPGGNQSFVLASIFGMIYVPFYLMRKYRLAY